MKEKVIEEFGIQLLDSFTTDQIEVIQNKLIMVLEGCSITKTSGELIVYEHENEDLMKKYVACMMLDGKSIKTVKMYVGEIKRFLNVCPVNLKETTVMDIRTYFAHQLQRGVSKRTINNSRNFLSSFFYWMVREKETLINPLENLNHIKYDKEIKEPFTDIELDAMRSSHLSMRDRALLEVLVSSGIRVAELCKLNRNDIDFHSLKVHIHCGKGGKDRFTFISKVASHYLTLYLNSRNDNDESLFMVRPNRSVSYQQRMTSNAVRYALKEIGKKSGVCDVHPHKFRHTFATSLYNKGMDLHEIQKLLGHSSINTTLVYISSNDNKLEQSYKKYNI